MTWIHSFKTDTYNICSECNADFQNQLASFSIITALPNAQLMSNIPYKYINIYRNFKRFVIVISNWPNLLFNTPEKILCCCNSRISSLIVVTINVYKRTQEKFISSNKNSLGGCDRLLIQIKEVFRPIW